MFSSYFICPKRIFTFVKVVLKINHIEFKFDFWNVHFHSIIPVTIDSSTYNVYSQLLSPSELLFQETLHIQLFQFILNQSFQEILFYCSFPIS